MIKKILDFKIKDKPIKLWKFYKFKEVVLFRSLVSDPFRFVEFSIKSNSHLSQTTKDSALMYWKQSEEFFKSSKDLSIYSRPLPIYYSFLNAVKCLLEVDGRTYTKFHGIGASLDNGKTELERFVSEVKPVHHGNIFPVFMDYLTGIPGTDFKRLNLYDMFYLIPFTHRAFLKVFKVEDMFLPIEAPRFSVIDNQIHLTAKCLGNNLTYVQNIEQMIKNSTEFKIQECESQGRTDQYLISNLSCTNDPIIFNQFLKDNYLKLRNSFEFIEGDKTLWYFKRTEEGTASKYPAMALAYAISHRLSDLSRYSPMELKEEVEKPHGWILHEFVESVLEQFISFIACEITRDELAQPKIR